MLADKIPAGEPPCADDALVEALLVEAIIAPPPQARRARVAVDGV